jgi:hypothetical protein
MEIGKSPSKAEGSGVSVIERVMVTPGAVKIP